MTRVLIGDFGHIVRLGFEDLLEEVGMDVVTDAHADRALTDQVVESLPDVVLLDLDAERTSGVALDITHGYPSVTVIACSSNTPRMRVFPSFHRGEFYEAELSPESLVNAVKSNR